MNEDFELVKRAVQTLPLDDSYVAQEALKRIEHRFIALKAWKSAVLATTNRVVNVNLFPDPEAVTALDDVINQLDNVAPNNTFDQSHTIKLKSPPTSKDPHATPDYTI